MILLIILITELEHLVIKLTPTDTDLKKIDCEIFYHNL